MRAKRGFRVRGLSTSPSITADAETAPHPNPLPAERGEGAHRSCVPYPPILATSASDTSKLA